MRKKQTLTRGLGQDSSDSSSMERTSSLYYRVLPAINSGKSERTDEEEQKKLSQPVSLQEAFLLVL